MVDLVGIQIKDLQTTPAVSGTTEFPLQRNSVDKAEKASLQNLLSWILVSSDYVANVNTNVNSKITAHINASDPHGDRAYANSILNTHTTGTDPHGDRAFATNAITSGITAHINASDPHGDRSFATGILNSHTVAVDPHGDRAFATSAANSAQTNAVTSANTYTDNKITTEFTNRVGTSVAPLVGGKVPNTYINAPVIYNPYSSFPGTGSTTLLYVDTNGNDIYRWNGTSYVNMTPAVDIGSLNLTTNDVAPGSNTDRQYLTAAKNTEFSNKITDVFSETSSGISIYSRKSSNTIFLKNLAFGAPLKAQSQATDIVVTDNTYTYQATSAATDTLLTYVNSLKSDALSGYYTDTVYKVKGDVLVYCPQAVAGANIVNEYNKFEVEAVATMLGVTEAVDPIASASFNSTGATLSGTGAPNSSAEVYDRGFTLIDTLTINALGNFSKTYSPPKDLGQPFYIYNKLPSGERSSKITVFSPNLGTLRVPTNISATSDGTKIRGMAERLVSVEIKNATDVVIGTGTADSNGYFEVTVSPAVIEADEIKINTSNSYSTTSPQIDYTVEIKPINAPYYVRINNARTSIDGKAPPDSTVSLYNSSSTLIRTFTTNSSGLFSGTLTGIATSATSFFIEATDTVDISTRSSLNVPAYYTVNTEPKPIPILVDSNFEFLFKNITKNQPTTDFEFDLVINETTNNIELKGTNTLGKDAKWTATFKIDTSLI